MMYVYTYKHARAQLGRPRQRCIDLARGLLCMCILSRAKISLTKIHLGVISLHRSGGNTIVINVIGERMYKWYVSYTVTEQDPEISLQCRRVWDKRGFMNISVDWSLSSPLPLPAIRRFSVVPLLIDSSRSGLFGRIHQYPRHRINTQVNRPSFRIALIGRIISIPTSQN